MYTVNGSSGGFGQVNNWSGTFVVEDGSKSILDTANISAITAEHSDPTASFTPTFSAYFIPNNYVTWNSTGGGSSYGRFRVLLDQGVGFGGSWNDVLGRSYALAPEQLNSRGTFYEANSPWLFNAVGGTISFSAPPEPVPVPLPLLGVPGLFLYSRKLRKRIQDR